MSVQAIGWVLDHSKSTGAARCVLVAIANHLGGDGAGWVYVDRVCREANCSYPTYQRAVTWAVDNGELERVPYAGGGARTHVRHRPNLFRFPALVDGCTPQSDKEGGYQIDNYPPPQSDNHNSGAVSRAVSTNEDTSETVSVFEAWVAATGRDVSKTKLTADRRKRIKARLSEGFSVDELCDAVRGVTLSEFHMGDNDRQQRYDDLTVVLRNGSQVEKFRDLWRNPPGRRRPKAFGAIERAVLGKGQVDELASGR